MIIFNSEGAGREDVFYTVNIPFDADYITMTTLIAE